MPSFGLVGISPPNSKEELESKIEELTKLRDELEDAGAADLEKESADLEKTLEAEVRKELEAENRAFNDGYGDEYD